MTFSQRLLFAALLTGWATGTNAAKPLALYIASSPPYQYQMDGKIRGTTIDALQCVLKDTAWQSSIREVPQRRAIHALSKASIDGYFAITPSRELNSFAVLSAPMALEKWYFYSLRPLTSLKDTRIGVVAGSNEALWLEAMEIDVAIEVSSLGQLVALLNRGRIDTLLVDRNVMDAYLKTDHRAEAQSEHFSLRFVRFAPLGLYLNREFVETHPNFLPIFNTRLESCVTTSFELDPNETREVTKVANRLYRDLTRVLDLPASLQSAETSASLAQILNINEQWQAARPNGVSQEALKLLQNATSKALNEWQSEQAKRVTEVMLMDVQGALTAASRVTSDYWQGDEEKFQAAVNLRPGTFFISPLNYDASARRFQVHASTPVFSQDNELIGVLSIGIDIEKALRGLGLTDSDQLSAVNTH